MNANIFHFFILIFNQLDKPGSKYFRVPSNNKELYTDVEENEKFTTDKYFAQFRLAGLNPMSIQRITQEGKDTYLAA